MKKICLFVGQENNSAQRRELFSGEIQNKAPVESSRLQLKKGGGKSVETQTELVNVSGESEETVSGEREKLKVGERCVSGVIEKITKFFV